MAKNRIIPVHYPGGHAKVWPEAEVIREPARRHDGSPIVLVRRKRSGLVGPEVDVAYFEGNPHISLFTGAGGFDLGLEAAGFCTVLQHEMAAMCCETLIANRPKCFRHAALIQGDIYKTPTSMLLREAGLYVGECHVVTGGPPCQGFSTSNMQAWGKGKTDARNDLVFEFVRRVGEIRPKYFIFENVPGLVRFNKGEYMRRFLETAYGCYYELVYALLDCSNYGVPQRRVRFICVGSRRDMVEIDGKLGTMPKPTNFSPPDLKVIRAADGNLFGSNRADLMTMAPGIRYFPDRPVLAPPSPHGNNHDGMSPGYLEFYDRLRREEPDRIAEAA
jgi:site-specific DNA-cytosine methylase